LTGFAQLIPDSHIEPDGTFTSGIIGKHAEVANEISVIEFICFWIGYQITD